MGNNKYIEVDSTDWFNNEENFGHLLLDCKSCGYVDCGKILLKDLEKCPKCDRLVSKNYSYPDLPNPKRVERVEGEDQYKMADYYVETYKSICPHCDNENKWATTGLLAPIECNVCKILYKMFII